MGDQEVFSWFRQLPSYRRLEALCQLLNLCVPLEIRFVESYLTKLASRENLFLKEHEVKANNSLELAKLVESGGGPLDGPCRSRLVLTLALLKSDNCSGASTLFPVLQNGLPVDKSSLALLEPKCLEELVLLYAMSSLHPAFSYSQHTSLESLKSGLEKLTQPKGGSTMAATPVPNLAVAPGGQPVYTYPVPVISSLLPPHFQWCPPPNVQMPAVVPAVPPGFSAAQMSGHKLSQVVIKPGQSSQKVTLCGTFTDGRQVHVIKDFSQIAELRNKITGQSGNSSLPSLSTMYNNNTEAVHKEIRELFDEICANFADLELVSSFFEQPQQRFMAPPPPYSSNESTGATTHTSHAVQDALRCAQLKKYIPKFRDVNSMNDFCSLSLESLKVRGLSAQAIQRIQRLQAANGAVSGAVGQVGANGSSEEDSTPPSLSPSPPAHAQFNPPPPQYYGIIPMPLVQQAGGTTYVPATYQGYSIPTFVSTTQQNGTFVGQGVSNGHQLVHSMMLPPPCGQHQSHPNHNHQATHHNHAHHHPLQNTKEHQNLNGAPSQMSSVGVGVTTSHKFYSSGVSVSQVSPGTDHPTSNAM